MAKRLLVRDQQGERERLLVGTMTVGRDTRCDISDSDPLLSRRHAEFVCRPDSLVVRDLNSRNGVVVNGVKVQEAVLRPGDVVKIARLVMTYLGDHDSIRPPSESGPVIDLPLRPPPAVAEAPGRPASSQPGGPVSPAAGFDRRSPDTEKVPAVRVPAGLEGASPGDDRTRVVPRRSGPHASSPGQVAVARLTPTTPLPPAQSAGEQEVEDADRTKPMVRPMDARTDAPVLPLSALGQAPSAPSPPSVEPQVPPVAVRAIEVPPVVASPVAAPPTASLPIDDLPLELGPRPTGPPPRAAARPKRGGGGVVAATLGLAVFVFALAAVPLVVWMTYHRDAPPVVWNFVVVLGPSLLGSLAAGLGLGRWLRRMTTED